MTSPGFLDGGGDMGAMMRAMDWSRTPLGAVTTWPQSLRTTVSTCLNSRFPILIWWGPQFVKLYNDAYREVLGAKHPHAMGAPGREVWPEIWHIIGPMLEGVVSNGRATWSEDQFLPLERYGFPEECYFTFSYSPIRDESGGVGGVFCAVTETTGRVIGERRLRLLQELAAESAAGSADEACRRATAVLARDPSDVLFAAVYLFDASRTRLRRAAATGIPADSAALPPAFDMGLADADTAPWPIASVLSSGTMAVVESPGISCGRAFVMPVRGSDGAATGILLAGISAHLRVDEQYRGFAALLGREIGGAIAQSRAIEDEKRRAEALAEIDRAKTAFFSNVSHEFRTPLTLLLSPVEDALAAPGSGLSGDELTTVHRNALRLLKLVNTLLDFARIEAGRAHASFEPIDLAQLTADLASAFRSAMVRAGLRFDVECPPISTPVYVDRDMWEKIVLNLLSNALKYTFDGSVSLSLRDLGDQVELQVRDTGSGIPDHELPHVFDRFHRVHGVRARTHEGSGIGLALVNELVKMHGGSLAVASRVGEGTTFTVALRAGSGHLPPEMLRDSRAATTAAKGARLYVGEALGWLPPEPDAASGTPSGDAAPAADRGAPTILVADDNADMRQYISRLLADRWRIEAVADGGAALNSARTLRPALVVSDVMMPELDGFGLLRELRADPRTADIPVILLSARAGEEASIEGLAAGADDYIVKPFSARELRARVEAQLLRAEIRSIQAAHDRRLADIFKHAPVAVAILRGPDHVFEFVNEHYQSVIGGRAVVGKPVREALPELARQGICGLLDRVYASGQPFTADSLRVMMNRGPDGEPEEVFFNFVYQPMRGREGEVDGIAVVAVDITELARARRDAEAANRAKDQFLAILGHELRNPLAPILTAVQLLQVKGPPDPHLQRLRDTIYRQTMHLAKLVDDLLDVGRIMTGKLRLDKQRVDLNSVVKQAVEASSPLIQRRGHTLHVSLAESPLYVEADDARIVQVVCNLLNNAAKYMPEGGRIELSARLQQGSAVVSVRDAGVGIAPEMLDRIFERFVQLGSGRDGSEGLGIGLSLVKAIVELHGGRVAAHSNGTGTGS
jgi:signal transduction histidine kinase/DNA-binding NarL/FixJ family response regulator